MTPEITGIQIDRIYRGRKDLNYSTSRDINGKISGEELIEGIREETISTAKQARYEEEQKGFDKKPIIAVDGKVGKAMEDMKPWGRIEYIARADIAESLLDIFRFIIEASKRVTGRYMDSVWVLHNKSVIAKDYNSFKSFLENNKNKEYSRGDSFVFVNTAPYANFLELEGVTSKSPAAREHRWKRRETKNGRVRKPNGAMTIALRATNRKYKNTAYIKYTQVLGSDIGLRSPAKGSGVGRIRQTGKSKGKPYVYPAILYYVDGR